MIAAGMRATAPTVTGTRRKSKTKSLLGEIFDF
jgi:hypothetical protein